MCEFFSFISDHKKLYYFDWPQRQQIKKGELKRENGETIDSADSHSQIAAYYGLNIDKVNKYEYNFFTKKLNPDKIILKENPESILKLVKKIDSKKIVEPLIVKRIVNPFKMRKYKIELPEAIELCRQWASVRAAVRDAVWAAVRDAVRDAVCDAVGAAVWDAVWASVWASVKDAVWDAVRDAVWAYISSFFAIDYKYDLSPCIKLWESGYVPSFDGTVWRLHGHNGRIVWKGKF